MRENESNDLPLGWKKFRIFSTFIAGVLIPLVIAFVGYLVNAAIKERELSLQYRELGLQYVELAVGVLQEPPRKETENLRKWSIDVINHYAPVPLSAQAISELEQQQLPAKTGVRPMDISTAKPQTTDSSKVSFLVASDCHFDENSDRTTYLKALLTIFTQQPFNSHDFYVINGDLMEYGDLSSCSEERIAARLDKAKSLIEETLQTKNAILGRLFFTVGNNEFCEYEEQISRHSLKSFMEDFIPSINGRNCLPYWWDPLGDSLRSKGVALFGFYLPDREILDQSYFDHEGRPNEFMDAQLTAFEHWVDDIVATEQIGLAVIFMHHGPAQQRTDGLPVNFCSIKPKDIPQKMKKQIEKEELYLSCYAKRLALALKRLDKNSNAQSHAHALIVAGHYHVGRVIKHLEGGLDLVLDGSIVPTRNVCNPDLHTFVEIHYTRIEGDARYDAMLDIVYYTIQLGDTPKARPIMKAICYVPKLST